MSIAIVVRYVGRIRNDKSVNVGLRFDTHHDFRVKVSRQAIKQAVVASNWIRQRRLAATARRDDTL